MKKFTLVLALSFVVAGSAFAINPNLTGGGGGMNVLDTGRTVLWSEPVNLDGLIASSEIIGQFALETELANDFYLTSDATILVAIWWGGYYNNNGCSDVGYGTNWNLRLYDDGGCVPMSVLNETLCAFANENFIYCQGGFYPIFKYCASVDWPLTANTLYWFGCNACDHAFPPQVGRVASAGVVGCDTVFKSAYFSYPDWTPGIDVFGVAFDASQEFGSSPYDCDTIIPTTNTTWGAIKMLYR